MLVQSNMDGLNKALFQCFDSNSFSDKLFFLFSSSIVLIMAYELKTICSRQFKISRDTTVTCSESKAVFALHLSERSSVSEHLI